MIVGAASIFVSTGLYVLFPSFIGAVVATIFEAFGYACIQGASEALVHDALAAENRTHAVYERVVSAARAPVPNAPRHRAHNLMAGATQVCYASYRDVFCGVFITMPTKPRLYLL